MKVMTREHGDSGAWMTFRARWAKTTLVAAVALLGVGRPSAQDRRPILTAQDAGVAMADGRLLVALPLLNRADVPVTDVTVTHVTLNGEAAVRPSRLPLSLGDLDPGARVVLQLAFPWNDAAHWPHPLVVRGTYRANGRAQPFAVTGMIERPLPDEGTRQAGRGRIGPRTVDGAAFPPATQDERTEGEPEPPPLPQEFDDPPLPAPDNASVAVLEALDGGGIPGVPAVSFTRIEAEPLTGADIKGGSPWDPSGASVDQDPAGQVVFLTGNLYALLSTDGGANFTHIDPTTIFGSFPLDGLPNQDLGLCCDMNMIYIPRIDRFVWLLHTKGSKIGERVIPDGPDKGKKVDINAFNRLRVAVASPQDVVASGGTKWTYWDMTTAFFGLGAKAFLDYPDVSFTEASLLISVANTDPQGFFVIRVPLNDVQSGGVINVAYTDPSDKTAFGGRLAHDSRDAAYWFGNATDMKVRIYEWRDGSSTYSWRSRLVPSWPIGDYVSVVPGGTDWLEKNSSAIRGATVRDEFVGFDLHRSILVAWNAARGGGFPQPYVRLQRFVRVTSGGSTQWLTGTSSQIWNPDLAFNHAHLATNSNGEVGVSVGVGGATSHATPTAGFLGDPVFYVTGISTASLDRYGDYTAIRPHWPNTKLFSVSDYFLEQTTVGTTVHHQYRLFGRAVDAGSRE